jgi:hypothetical protein
MRASFLAAITLSAALAAACAAAAPSGATVPPGPTRAPTERAETAEASTPASQSMVAAAEAGADSALSTMEPSDASTGEPDASAPTACNEQAPQDFLVRGNFLKAGPTGNERAIQYRTDEYGYFKGYGRPGSGAQPPSAFLVATTFMGLPIKMHGKVAPALGCVEEEIRRTCGAHPYTPHALAGIRYKNTYRGGEVTNHAYGIAIDVDPSINTCCGCVKPWNEAPACTRPAKTEYDRMAMPECWVHAFERFGFYWLGHDVLRDTMHFEFLGDPDKIKRVP